MEGQPTHPVTRFDEIHGADGPPVRYGEGGAWVLFPDGARREYFVTAATMMVTTADPFEKAKRVRLYWEIRVRQAVAKFKETKQGIALLARNAIAQPGPQSPDSGGAVKHLQDLADQVKTLQAELDAAREAEKAAKPPEDLQREKTLAATRQAGEELLSAVESINI